MKNLLLPLAHYIGDNEKTCLLLMQKKNIHIANHMLVEKVETIKSIVFNNCESINNLKV